MFVGRKAELKEFNELYKKNCFQMLVIYGRRRVGKTSFINEFCKGKENIFFSCDQSNYQENLNKYSKLVLDHYKDNREEGFVSFESAINYIIEHNKNKKKSIVLVFDEFPYLVNSNKSILSKLQNYIDNILRNKNVFLILCGSYVSFMEEKLLGKKSPIYGRRTSQLKLQPFNYFESKDFFNKQNYEQKLLYYGIFGGTPLYLNYIETKKNIKSNVNSLILKKTGYLYEEPDLLLKQEISNPNVYYSIIEAIANGYTKLNEISTKTGEANSKCTKYLSVLIKLDIIERITPIYEKSSSRKSIYLIKDNFFKFWFRYVMGNKTLLESGNSDIVYEKKIMPTINDFMGHNFEKICMEYLLRMNSKGKLPFLFTDIGKWWGTNTKTKKQEEIDIVASDKNDYLFAECKWTNTKIDESIYDELKGKSEWMYTKGKKYYFLFSKSGFTKKLKENAKGNKNLFLVELNHLFVL